MVNFRVIKMRSILKVAVVIALIIVVFQFIRTRPQAVTEVEETKVTQISKETLIKYLNYSLPGYLANTQDNVQKLEINFSADKILKFELEMLNNVIEKSDLQIDENKLSNDDIDELLANQEDIQTEVIQTQIQENYNLEESGVKISNKSSLDLTNDILKPDFEPTNKNDIIIFHTHTCESYTPTEQYQYDTNGNYRTIDLNYTVARVGDELEKYLKKFGFNVIHDKTLHDYPAYSGSYDNSYETVSRILDEHSGTEIIFDIHRDAVGNDNSYAPTVKIGEDYVAQIMFVIGTNGGGLEHNNWQNNLKSAIKIQQKANEMYPGLFKPIVVRNSRYNQNLGNSASIIEVGATGNTLEQAMNSMKYLALVLNELW